MTDSYLLETCVLSQRSAHRSRRCYRFQHPLAAQITQQQAQAGVNKVVLELRRNKTAVTELGKLEEVTKILGYGSPSPGTLAVRFNASFRKGGMGRVFGQQNSSKEGGRSIMVGQVKASLNTDTNKIISCSVFRDLGYGRAFELTAKV